MMIRSARRLSLLVPLAVALFGCGDSGEAPPPSATSGTKAPDPSATVNKSPLDAKTNAGNQVAPPE